MVCAALLFAVADEKVDNCRACNHWLTKICALGLLDILVRSPYNDNSSGVRSFFNLRREAAFLLRFFGMIVPRSLCSMLFRKERLPLTIGQKIAVLRTAAQMSQE